MPTAKQPEYRINLRPYRILYFPFLLPIALLLALFNKISPIPFKIYALRVERVGQMIGNQEEFYCALELGMLPKEFRVFVHRDIPSNMTVLAMQKRVMPIYNCFLPLFDVCHKFGGLGVSSMDLCKLAGSDRAHLVTKTKQHVDFSDAEKNEAQRQCRKIGIDPDAPFIPVLARDNAYLKSIKEPTDLDSYRNVDLDTFIPAMEFLADKHKVLRMGSVVKSELKTKHPNIFDYSLSGHRTELLDIYLSAKCRFFFSSATGLDAIASLAFRIPVLYVDFIPVNEAPILKPNCIMIPKKYWHKTEERYLTLSELLESRMAEMYTPQQLMPHNVVVHDNTPEEILAAAQEMEARLDGTWIETKEDQDRQKQFWSHFKRQSKDNICTGYIGAKFLEENPYWLK